MAFAIPRCKSPVGWSTTNNDYGQCYIAGRRGNGLYKKFHSKKDTSRPSTAHARFTSTKVGPARFQSAKSARPRNPTPHASQDSMLTKFRSMTEPGTDPSIYFNGPPYLENYRAPEMKTAREYLQDADGYSGFSTRRKYKSPDCISYQNTGTVGRKHVYPPTPPTTRSKKTQVELNTDNTRRFGGITPKPPNRSKRSVGTNTIRNKFKGARTNRLMPRPPGQYKNVYDEGYRDYTYSYGGPVNNAAGSSSYLGNVLASKLRARDSDGYPKDNFEHYIGVKNAYENNTSDPYASAYRSGDDYNTMRYEADLHPRTSRDALAGTYGATSPVYEPRITYDSNDYSYDTHLTSRDALAGSYGAEPSHHYSTRMRGDSFDYPTRSRNGFLKPSEPSADIKRFQSAFSPKFKAKYGTKSVNFDNIRRSPRLHTYPAGYSGEYDRPLSASYVY
ncbi:unnamed protein product [Owenia fusiformis]|uniref:Uncharacterized protein n=1 Tax=Owenia fusiformis TaxID=6347 RepID=A0A8J1UCB0_OWEFU|nr:unnamed protein product [Owenia fusiformis]